MKHETFEMKDTGEGDDSAAIVTKAMEDFQKVVAGRLDEIEKKSGDRMDKLEAKLNRPAIITGAGSDLETKELEKKAFESFLRGGASKMGADEVKSLTVTGDTALAPPEFGTEALKLLVQYSPIRRYARVVTIGAAQVQYPRRTGIGAASWVAETGARTESESTYEAVDIAPYELATFTDVSNQLLEDNAYNLEGEVVSDFGINFGKTEGAAFVIGDGNGKPKGLLNAANIAQMTTGNASGFPTTNPADVLITMFHALPTPHAQNAVWLMNRKTMGALRQFKDSIGRYLLVDPLSEGAPSTLLGRPIAEAIDMPDIGAGNTPIMFGDLKGYRIVDRVGLNVLRDPYTQQAVGQVRFHARRRVGGDVTHPDRFIKLQVAA